MPFDTISVIGLGYIGLPTAAMFASKQMQVVGVDVNTHVVTTINAGEIHIVEPGLEDIVRNSVDGGFLRATKSPEPADVFLIAVPTPFLPSEVEDSIPKPDLSYIKSAAKSVAYILKKGDLVILESTSPVGTTEQMAQWMAEEREDLTFPQTHGDSSDIRVAYCPERVLPGHVIRELVENDRVIGGMTERCCQAAIETYKIFVEGECIVTSARVAEMVKLTENAFRDVNIAFANELSMICDGLNIDVWALIKLANRHPRVDILRPGAGVGGHCSAVDPWFIVDKSPEQARLIHGARLVNDSKPEWVVEKVKVAISELLLNDPQRRIDEISIACFGLSFKPDIDDLRQSPALEITKMISNLNLGLTIAVEPNISQLPDSVMSFLRLTSIDFAMKNADIFVLLVDHREFRDIDMSDEILNGKKIIDTQGIWN